MITEYDERVCNGNVKEFKEAAQEVMNHFRNNFMDYAQPPRIRGYSRDFKPKVFRDAFDRLMMNRGFEIDARTLRHAHGIGNNNRWDVVDKDLNKVGEFYANNNMYHGVYIGVISKDGIIDKFEICSGGFIRG